MRRRSAPKARDVCGARCWDIDALNGMASDAPRQWLESTPTFETEVTGFSEPLRSLGFCNSQPLGHLFVEEAFALPVWLHPFAVDYELRDGTLASVLDHFVCCSGRVFDIDVLKRDVVLLQKALGYATVGAPEGGINGYLHGHI